MAKKLLKQLLDMDEVQRIVSKSQNPEYDHKAICRYCGRLYEFEDEDIQMSGGNPYPFMFCDCGKKLRLNKKYRHIWRYRNGVVLNKKMKKKHQEIKRLEELSKKENLGLTSTDILNQIEEKKRQERRKKNEARAKARAIAKEERKKALAEAIAKKKAENNETK